MKTSYVLILALIIPVMDQKICYKMKKEELVIDLSKLAKKKVETVKKKEKKKYREQTTVYERMKRWEKIISIASKKYDVDKNLIKSVIAQESGAYSNVDTSSAGARSLMQLLPSTAEMFGVKDIDNPYDNILGGTRCLRYLLKMFENDEELVIASYNAGWGSVLKHGGIPPYRETQEYVKSVKEYKKAFEMYEKESIKEMLSAR